ncbi:hypothetical protein [Flavobacterium sp. XGLA_31]|uniref:hypothetical protein n=1 Tax=Flavobacterium sp. XGLA_31 TaxID=3447666 RepID=UPI003F3742D5
MKTLLLLALLTATLSCTSKKDTKKLLLPAGIKATTEIAYRITNNHRTFLYKKQQVFTANGRIKYSKTVDSLGNILQETEKKMWFIKETTPNSEPLYYKNRWKTHQRERISGYTQKQHKQNEAIYHYNPDGTIAKIVDNFTTFHTQYFYYTNGDLTKIITKDKNNTLLDDVTVSCLAKDQKGTCLKQIRTSTLTHQTTEINLIPTY